MKSEQSEQMVATVSDVIGDGAEAHRLVRVGAWNLTAWVGRGEGEEPRIDDRDLGERLGYERPGKVKDLIKAMISAGKLNDFDVFPKRGQTSERGGRPSTTFWLTEEAALLVATQSETPAAWGLTREMVHVYMLARRGLLPQQAGLAREDLSAVLAPVTEVVGVLAKTVDALVRRMDAFESRPAVHAGPGIGGRVAEEQILEPIRRIARLKAAAIGKPRAYLRLRFTEDRSLRRELSFPLDAAQRWRDFPQTRIGEAAAIVARMLAEAGRLAAMAERSPAPSRKLGSTTIALPFGVAANDAQKKAN